MTLFGGACSVQHAKPWSMTGMKWGEASFRDEAGCRDQGTRTRSKQEVLFVPLSAMQTASTVFLDGRQP